MSDKLTVGAVPVDGDLTQDVILAGHANEIRRLGKRVVADVIEIGARLAECKEILGRRNFLSWLNREFGWSEDTAERFIQVHALSGQIPQLAEFALPISGLYLLAAPPEARAAIIERAQDGEPISVTDVRQTIDRARRGATGVAMHPHAERGLDLYETPAPVTRALLAAETFTGTTWECANGRGAISRVLRAAGYRVVATDIEDYGCADAQSGVNFLQQTAAPDGVTTIVTNPPFMHADAFVRQALKLVPRVVMLLRFLFAEGVGRSDILDGGQLARVHVFRSRLQIHRDGWPGPHASNQIAMAWFVWDREHRGPTELRRISWEPDEAPFALAGRDE